MSRSVFRKPSLKKRIAARTSLKRYARNNLGLKAQRGLGWLTNPRRAAYNRLYNRTAVGRMTLPVLLIASVILAAGMAHSLLRRPSGRFPAALRYRACIRIP